MADITSTLADIEARLVAATGPDRELDYDILRALDPAYMQAWDSFYEYLATPMSNQPLTSSLDAAVSLAKRVLPGWARRISTSEYGDHHSAVLSRSHPTNCYEIGKATGAGREALALCIAIIRALKAERQ